MQPPARKASERQPQVDSKLDDVIPGAEQEDIVAARINDVDVARRLLLSSEKRKLHCLALVDAAYLAAADRVDIMLEEERQLPR